MSNKVANAITNTLIMVITGFCFRLSITLGLVMVAAFLAIAIMDVKTKPRVRKAPKVINHEEVITCD